MVTATLTTKGQITIPKSVRDALRLRSGDRVEIVLHGDSEAVLRLRPTTKSVDDVFGTLADPSQLKLSVTEKNTAVPGRFRERKLGLS